MAQAKSLTIAEFKRLLKSVSVGRYSSRDRAMVLLSFWSGMRVGEIAALKIGDVLSNDENIKEEIRLKAEQTNGSKGRTVMIGSRLCVELVMT